MWRGYRRNPFREFRRMRRGFWGPGYGGGWGYGRRRGPCCCLFLALPMLLLPLALMAGIVLHFV